MMQFKGTKRQIMQQWMHVYKNTTQENSNAQLDEEAFSLLFDVIDQYSAYLADEELFTVLNETYDLKEKLIASDAEYYISLTRGTWILCSALASEIGGFALTAFMGLLENYLGEKINGPIIKKLQGALGENCIMLEASRNKKAGIDKNILKMYKGECGNAMLKCGYQEDGQCKCSAQDVAEICEKLTEEGLLEKKGGKYFYRDML